MTGGLGGARAFMIFAGAGEGKVADFFPDIIYDNSDGKTTKNSERSKKLLIIKEDTNLGEKYRC